MKNAKTVLLFAGRQLRASDLVDNLGQDNNPEWKTIAIDEATGELIAPQGSIGYRWGEDGKWNLQQKDGKTDQERNLRLSLVDSHDEVVSVGFPGLWWPAKRAFPKC